MIVLVQQIDVWWTKASRGGEAARLRNSVPRSFPAPAAARRARANDLIHQYLEHREEHEFAARDAVDVQPFGQGAHARFVGLRLRRNGERVEVLYRAGWEAGRPERYAPEGPVLTLTAGRWGRVEDNGRYSSQSGPWRYRLSVWNIGAYEQVPGESWAGEPVKTYSALADLY